MRSNFSSRSLHLAFGVTEGNFEPRPAAAARRCLRPTRGGGGGGSHFFFFFSFCGREQWDACHVAVDQPMIAQAVPRSGPRQNLRMLAARAVGVMHRSPGAARTSCRNELPSAAISRRVVMRELPDASMRM